MSEWYYAQQEQQLGPVPLSQLQRMIADGTLNPATDLVWQQGMADWLPAAQVPAVMSKAPLADESSSTDLTMAGETSLSGASSEGFSPMAPMISPEWEEITPGSAPIDVGGCIARGFDLTKRHFGVIFLVGLVYVGISIAMGTMIGIVDNILGVNNGGPSFRFDPASGEVITTSTGPSPSGAAVLVSFFLNLVSNVVSIFLWLGVTRIGLNLVSGKPAEVGMIFGEGSKLLRGVGAGILYGLMVGFGLLLLIVPGIYLALRYGQYFTAIVDRDLGVIESFSYSSDLTTNNRMSLLGLAILSFLIVLAGAIALCVGMIFAYPVVWLTGLVAYRWMQFGSVVVQERTV